VPIDVENYEGALGANLGKSGSYVISQRRVVNICNTKDFQEIQEFDVLEQGRIDDDEIHILYMAASNCQSMIGVLLGKDLQRGRIDVTHLQVYECKAGSKKFSKKKSMLFDFDEACREFVFSNGSGDELLFFTKDELVLFNYLTNAKTTMYKFENPLKSQPLFGKFNDEQSQFIVTSLNDVLFVDMVKHEQTDLDDQEGIEGIQDIFYFDNQFFILANK